MISEDPNVLAALARQALEMGDKQGYEAKGATYAKANALASLAVLTEVRKLKVAVEGSAR